MSTSRAVVVRSERCLLHVPSAEIWSAEDMSPRARFNVKHPASAAHIWGKPVVNAETFTGQPESSKMLGHPYRLKQIGEKDVQRLRKYLKVWRQLHSIS